tara:strand:- start:115 stop:819 length:705 start_codon:yes stop_codon:yes gene_type:complete
MKIKFSKPSVCKNLPFTKYLSDDLYHHKYILKNDKSIFSKAAFFDRDGVIIKDKHFLSNPDLIEFEEGAKSLLSKFKKNGWKVVVVTNQSGIYRNLFQWSDYEIVSERLLQLLGAPSLIDAIYANGFGPNLNKDSWRKPNPEMIFEAKKDLNIDLKSSIIIGDRLTDIVAGIKAGLKIVYHVKTGYGTNERTNIEKLAKRIDYDFNVPDTDGFNKPIMKFADGLLDILNDKSLF